LKKNGNPAIRTSIENLEKIIHKKRSHLWFHLHVIPEKSKYKGREKNNGCQELVE
jgi:hypothetical protein